MVCPKIIKENIVCLTEAQVVHELFRGTIFWTPIYASGVMHVFRPCFCQEREKTSRPLQQSKSNKTENQKIVVILGSSVNCGHWSF